MVHNNPLLDDKNKDNVLMMIWFNKPLLGHSTIQLQLQKMVKLYMTKIQFLFAS